MYQALSWVLDSLVDKTGKMPALTGAYLLVGGTDGAQRKLRHVLCHTVLKVGKIRQGRGLRRCGVCNEI